MMRFGTIALIVICLGLEGCFTVAPDAERYAAPFELPAPNEIVRIPKGVTPLIVVGGVSRIVRKQDVETSSHETTFQWDGSDLDMVLKTIRERLVATCGVRVELNHDFAKSYLKPESTSGSGYLSTQESVWPTDLDVRRVQNQLPRGTTHLVLVETAIVTSAPDHKFGVAGGAGGVWPAMATERFITVSVDARIYSAASGTQLSRVRWEETAESKQGWLLPFPVISFSPDISKNLKLFSQRIGDELGRRIQPALPVTDQPNASS